MGLVESAAMSHSAIRSLYCHVVCNVPVSCKDNGYMKQVGDVAGR